MVCKRLVCHQYSVAVWSLPRLPQPLTRDTFYKWLMTSKSKSYNDSFRYTFDFYDAARSKFCTCHDSSAVVACAKFISGWVIIFTESKTYSTRFGVCAHKLFVKLVPGHQHCPQVISGHRGRGLRTSVVSRRYIKPGSLPKDPLSCEWLISNMWRY